MHVHYNINTLGLPFLKRYLQLKSLQLKFIPKGSNNSIQAWTHYLNCGPFY